MRPPQPGDSQACTQHDSLRRECVERTSLERRYLLGLSYKPMLSHPHATETEGGTSAGLCVAFNLSYMHCTVKEGARLSQAPTGQDSLGPCDGQAGCGPGRAAA